MSRIVNDVTLVCYDIAHDKLRRQIDKTMKDFGTRIQHSVFMCRSDTETVNCCRKRLEKILDRHKNLKKSTDCLILVDRVSIEHMNCVLGQIDSQDSFRIF